MGTVASCAARDVVVTTASSGRAFEFDDTGDRAASLLRVVNGCDPVRRCRRHGILGRQPTSVGTKAVDRMWPISNSVKTLSCGQMDKAVRTKTS